MTVHAALRTATASAHAALEAAMDLDAEPLTLHGYTAALQVLHAMRAGWDPGLAALFPGAAGSHRAWLEQDLVALGAPRLPALPMLALTPAEAWGMRYVLEGSALGGRVIVRRAGSLGLTAARGARYFEGSGAETGSRWKLFLHQLTEAGTPDTVPQIVRGALRSFEALTRSASAHRAALSSLP